MKKIKTGWGLLIYIGGIFFSAFYGIYLWFIKGEWGIEGLLYVPALIALSGVVLYVIVLALGGCEEQPE